MDDEFRAIDESSRAIDAYLRGEHAKGSLVRFKLFVEAEIAGGRLQADTELGLVRPDKTGNAIRLVGASVERVADIVASPRARWAAPPLDELASKIAKARRRQTSLEGDATSSELARRVELVRASLQKTMRAAKVDCIGREVEASARHVVWFAADDASALTRTERTSLSLRCAFRVRVDPGPRMYGEDPEPDTAIRAATLEATSWPTDKQLADLVTSAARSS